MHVRVTVLRQNGVYRKRSPGYPRARHEGLLRVFEQQNYERKRHELVAELRSTSHRNSAPPPIFLHDVRLIHLSGAGFMLTGVERIAMRSEEAEMVQNWWVEPMTTIF